MLRTSWFELKRCTNLLISEAFGDPNEKLGFELVYLEISLFLVSSLLPCHDSYLEERLELAIFVKILEIIKDLESLTKLDWLAACWLLNCTCSRTTIQQ